MNIKIFSLLLVAIFCTNYVVEATHFRYGTIVWEPVSVATYNTIKFRIDLAFRKTYFSSSSIYFNNTIKHSTFNFGDGGTQDVSIRITEVNDAEDWFTGTFTTQYTYKKDGNYTAYYFDCCRISTLENNRDANWNVSSSVLVRPAKDQVNGILNLSPVVGGNPIVQVTAQQPNYYTIVATDTQPLTYSLSNLWGSSLSHPSGLTLNGNVITFTPGAVDNGKDYELYCTQIVVSDGISYTVVDFIFKAVRAMAVCDPSCTNDATPCGSDNTCKGCSSSLGGKTCLPKQPPVFITPPTPAAGNITTFFINTNSTYTISAMTPYKSLSVVISPANTKGITPGLVQTQNNAIINYWWIPTPNDAGSYVISADIKDSQGTQAAEGARAFILFVSKAICGNGEVLPSGGCNCSTGWSNETNCYDCSNGYHGPECKESEYCNQNGQSNDGVSGDGACVCYLGYTGKNCEIKVSQFCVPTNPSYVSDTATSKGFIQPTTITAVVSTTANTAALTLPITLNKPDSDPITNVLAVFDINPVSSSLLSSLKSEASDLVEGVTELNEGSKFSIGTYSDSKTSGFNYQQKYNIGTVPSNNLGDKIFKDSTTGTSVTYNSLIALNNAASANVGWEAGAFRVILLVTDTDYSFSTNNTDYEKETFNKLIENSIFPVIIGTNGALPNWASLVSKAGNFGIVKISSGGSDWRKQAVAGISQSYANAIPKVVKDDGAFITFSPSSFSVTTGTYNIGYKIAYPTAQPPVRPTIVISIIGFGKVTVNINYNHPPVAQPYQLGLDEDTSKSFSLVVTDIDSNLIKVAFPSLASSAPYGTIQHNNAPVIAGEYYDISAYDFVFVPKANAFGSFSIGYTASDGCATSSQTISVTITEINDPTTCSNLPDKTVSINTPATFNLAGTDVDDTVLVTLASFTDLQVAGTLKVDGANAVAGTQYANNKAFTYTQTDNSAVGTKTLTFTVSDGRGSSMSCSVKITLTHVNMPPSVTAATPISGIPTLKTQVNLQITDVDSTTGSVSFSTLTTTDNAPFYMCDSPSTPVTKTTPIPYTLTKQQTVVSICVNSTVQVATSNYATITFLATDSVGLPSSPFTVLVNLIGNRPNAKPTVNLIPDFSFVQGQSANAVIINGSDTDQKDGFDLHLSAIITKQPVNGKFVLASDPNTNAAASADAPYSIRYVQNGDFFGKDSFSYTVADELGLRATELTTNIEVIYKDYPPIVKIAPYVFNQYTPSTVQALAVSDVDILKVQDVVTCSITTLPVGFIMKQANGNTVISTAPTLLSDQTTYTYFVSVAPATYTTLNGNFTAVCVDKFSNSVPATGLLTYNYLNTPPTASNSEEHTDQNVAVNFAFDVSDLEDPNTVRVKFLTIPSNGKITCGGVLATIGGILSSSGCTYTPNEGLSDWDTLGHIGPLDTISFVSIDVANAQSSSTASVKFYVKPMNPPVYIGGDRLSTLEDNSLPLIITGQPGNGGSSYGVSINRITGNGTFSIAHCMGGGEGCVNSPITEFPTTSQNANSYNYHFQPVSNENGPAYMIVYFTLYETTPDYTLTSKEYSITIDVIPVNDPPTIQLVESQVVGDKVVPTPASGLVSIPMNTSVILTYTGSDIDSDNSKLVSVILALPLRGQLFVYDANAPDFIGSLVVSSTVIARQGDFWKLVYVPTKGSSSNGYAKIPIAIKDPELSVSSSATFIIDVDPINVPPVIFTNKVDFSVQEGNAVSITEVSFDDPDSTIYNNVSLTLTVLKADGKTVSKDSTLKLSGDYADSCVSTQGKISCVGNKFLLKSFLAPTITFNNTGGSYIIRVFVDDLGYNSGTSEQKRKENHLTATKDLTIKVTPLDAGTKKTSNKTVLSAAIAGAAVAAGVIAAGIWGFIKKAAPPTNAFFGDNPFADGAVTSNPLYAESANSGNNPFYEAQNA